MSVDASTPPATAPDVDAPTDAADRRPVTTFDTGAAVRLCDTGAEVVLLDRDPREVTAYGSGLVQHLTPDTTVEPIDDPIRRASLLTETIHGLNGRHAAALRDVQADHRRVLRNIRAYVIEKHRDGHFCRDGLNRFLGYFGLDEYEPRVRVTFTITGSYEVEGTDTDHADSDAHGYLRPDIREIDDLLDGSLDFTTTLDCDVVDD